MGVASPETTIIPADAGSLQRTRQDSTTKATVIRVDVCDMSLPEGNADVNSSIAESESLDFTENSTGEEKIATRR